MCGVFGYIGQRVEGAQIVLEGLKELEYRGYDSWGVAVVSAAVHASDEAVLTVKKQLGKIGDATVEELPEGSLAIGHTRWATHGGVTKENAHPHLDCQKDFAVIHNGIVENYQVLRGELIKKGHVFVSETDTEVIAHLLESLIQTLSFPEAFRQAFLRLEGLNAVVAIDRRLRQILVARKGSPLVVGFGKKEVFVASDASALLPYTQDVCFLEDDHLAEISETDVVIRDLSTQEPVVCVTQKLEWDRTSSSRGTFPHYMLKEIYEQPRVLSGIASAGIADEANIASLFQEREELFLVGCGTASYAALVGKYLLSIVAQRLSQALVGSESAYLVPLLSEKSLLFVLSQSGETIDILEPALAAQKKGVKLLALVNVLGSSLYRLANATMLIGAGPEKAVASTKAFTGKVGHLLLLSHALAGKLPEGQKCLEKAVHAIEQILQEETVQKIRALASHIQFARSVFVIGRGVLYPASLEVALKIKEISYIHAEGLAAGELKHGPLALVEKGTPCIVLLARDETYSASLAGALEMKARGAFVIGISPDNEDVFDVHLPYRDAGIASVLPIVVIGQLLAYALTLERGLDPDKPRNLAKSVTVK